MPPRGIVILDMEYLKIAPFVVPFTAPLAAPFATPFAHLLETLPLLKMKKVHIHFLFFFWQFFGTLLVAES